MKPLLLTCLLLGISLAGHSQVRSIWGHIGGAYIPMNEAPPAHEVTVRTAVALDIGQIWSFGLKTNLISYRDFLPGWRRFWLAGPFARAAIVTDRSRFYLESGLFLSNYRVDHNRLFNIGYRDPGVVYLAAGGGVELRLWRGLFLDLGYHGHGLRNRARPRYAYSTYFAGLLLRLREDH